MRGPPPLPHSPHAGKPWQHTGAPAGTKIIPKPRFLSSISLLTAQIYLAGVGGGVAAMGQVMSPEPADHFPGGEEARPGHVGSCGHKMAPGVTGHCQGHRVTKASCYHPGFYCIKSQMLNSNSVPLFSLIFAL